MTACTIAVASAVAFGAIPTSSQAISVPLTVGQEAIPIATSYIRHYRGYRSPFHRNNDAGVGLDAWTIAHYGGWSRCLVPPVTQNYECHD